MFEEDDDVRPPNYETLREIHVQLFRLCTSIEFARVCFPNNHKSTNMNEWIVGPVHRELCCVCVRCAPGNVLANATYKVSPKSKTANHAKIFGCATHRKKFMEFPFCDLFRSVFLPMRRFHSSFFPFVCVAELRRSFYFIIIAVRWLRLLACVCAVMKYFGLFGQNELLNYDTQTSKHVLALEHCIGCTRTIVCSLAYV